MVLGQLALTTFPKREEWYFVSPDEDQDIGNYSLLVTTGCSHVPLLKCPGGTVPHRARWPHPTSGLQTTGSLAQLAATWALVRKHCPARVSLAAFKTREAPEGKVGAPQSPLSTCRWANTGGGGGEGEE